MKDEILFRDYPKLKITKKTKEDVLANPDKYMNSEVRIFKGNFYTDEEYEKHFKEILNKPLPGEEKSRKRLIKKRY